MNVIGSNVRFGWVSNYGPSIDDMIRWNLGQTGHLFNGFLHVLTLLGIAFGAITNEIINHIGVTLQSQFMLAIESWNH